MSKSENSRVESEGCAALSAALMAVERLRGVCEDVCAGLRGGASDEGWLKAAGWRLWKSQERACDALVALREEVCGEE